MSRSNLLEKSMKPNDICAIGLFLFAFQIRLPAVIRSAFAMAGNTMGPVAMLIIGMLMADMDMQHLRSYRQLW